MVGNKKMLQSSSRREIITENHRAKKTGCMSGIFQLLHKQNHGRKRLTSAGKRDKNVISPAKSKPLPGNKQPAEIPGNIKEAKGVVSPGNGPIDCDFRRFSCDVPRSPTILSEIRRSSSVNSPVNFRRSPALVARLMGLEEIPLTPSAESASEKRRKLLGALEKCDEDLKALKKIIEAIRSAEIRRKSAPESVAADEVKDRAFRSRDQCILRSLDGGDLMMGDKKCSDSNGEQPSPVSVLDDISPSSKFGCNGREKGGQYKKLKDDNINLSFFQRRTTVESLPQVPDQSCRYHDPFHGFGLTTTMMIKTSKHSPFSSSKAIVKTVNEVWQVGVCEERWEAGVIVAVLEGDIFENLVEEIVRELLGYYYRYSLLPMEACRKRLCF